MLQSRISGQIGDAVFLLLNYFKCWAFDWGADGFFFYNRNNAAIARKILKEHGFEYFCVASN